MSTTNTLVETLKESLATLESGLSGRKSEIEKTFKTSVDAATKSRNESLDALKSEQEEVAKIKKAIAALGGDTKTTTTKTKKPSSVPNFTAPRNIGEAKTDNQKVYFALSELGSALIPDILTKVNSYGEAFDQKRVSNTVNALKNKFQVVVEDGKEGRAFKYKVA